MTYRRPGRPTNIQRAARAELDRQYAGRAAALAVVGERTKELGEYLAFLDGRDKLSLEDIQQALAAFDAETLAILRRPLWSF
jgi:hypothetical protein